MLPAENYFDGSDFCLCYFEWGEPGDQVILLLHATGFHARCWDKVVEALPSDTHVIAVDQLGHGRSSKPDSLADWAKTASATAELLDALRLQNIVGVGHSMGGHCLVRMAAESPERFQRLLLIDPVIMEPSSYDNNIRLEDINPSGHPIARRRAIWDSPQQFFDRLKDHPTYAIWQEDVLKDYCQYGLLKRDDGQYDLACPGYLEASVYMGSLCRNPYPLLGAVTAPTTILRAPSGNRDGQMDFTQSPTWEGLADQLPGAKDVYMSDLTHFMPMQDPEWIAGYIVEG